MSLLIDGYNLLHASGILGGGVGPGGLERSRTALLNFLAESLDAREAASTIVVFDASDEIRGLPRGFEHRGLRVRFSSGYVDADELIELLIRGDTTPRRLTVVSSDHRLQRAARRRKAHAVDSDKWFHALVRARAEKGRTPPPATKPPVMLDEAEVRYRLRKFGADDEAEAGEDQPPADEPTAMATDDSVNTPTADTESEEPGPGNPYHPFPPGYGDDVADEED